MHFFYLASRALFLILLHCVHIFCIYFISVLKPVAILGILFFYVNACVFICFKFFISDPEKNNVNIFCCFGWYANAINFVYLNKYINVY